MATARGYTRRLWAGGAPPGYSRRTYSADPEIILPYPDTLAAEPSATHIRGTLIVASTRTLKHRGHFERYRSALAPEHFATIVSSAAGMWLPIEVGIAHYRACDSLDLPVEEQLQIGGEIVHTLQKTFIGMVLKAASSGAGITPIAGMKKFTGVFSRSFKGGGACLVRLGPKDLRVEFKGLPVSGIRYFRVAYRGFIQAGCEMFARRVVVAELGKYLSETTVAYRIAWV